MIEFFLLIDESNLLQDCLRLRVDSKADHADSVMVVPKS